MATEGELLDAHGTPLSVAPPGLIVVANLDVDARRLPPPGEVSSHRLIRLDSAYPTKLAGDDEPVAIDVRVAPTVDLGSAEVLLSFEGPLEQHLRLYNARKQALPSLGAGIFELRFESARTLRLLVEADALSATPLAPTDETPTHMVLLINGQIQARTDVTIAPFLHANNLDRAERLYVCEIDAPSAEESNHPTIIELASALTDVKGVTLDKVPLDISLGDGWMQDQLEIGYCHAPGGLQRMVVHLPRARSNIVQTGPLLNLSGFVEEHFPSKDLGLFRDFWKRSFGHCQSADGTSRPLGFVESYEFLLLLDSVDAAWRTLADVYDFYAQEAELKQPFLAQLVHDLRSERLDYLERQRRLPSAVRMLRDFLAHERRRPGVEQLRARHSKTDEAAVQELGDRARETVALQPLSGKLRLRLNRRGTQAAFLDPLQVEALIERLRSLHDSTNYGGNIEASPPFADAPLGKIVIGSSPARPMEEQLERFLVRQGVQPVVKIDTSWLDVAHVDEVISFVPSNQGATAFAIPYASPATALKLLTTALDVRIQARLDGEDMSQYFLTDMLRGKYWLYTSPVEGGGFEILRPPFIHREYHFPNYLEPPRGHSQTYYAALDVDLLFERLSAKAADRQGAPRITMPTNRTIQTQFIDPLASDILAPHFSGMKQVALPVLYDELDPMLFEEMNPRVPPVDRIRTSAFLPNVVNMQVVNGVLLVPKPYGPRMGVKGAMATLKQCLDPKTHGLLTERELDRAGLLRVSHWEKGRQRAAPPPDGLDSTEPEDPLGTQGLELRKPSTDLQRIARQFRGGFLEGELFIDEALIENAILDRNKTCFDADGALRPGWHCLTIPERSVDLFEALTWAHLAALGNTVRFVDSWYYHVRSGEIHCGTQVLRRPAPKVNWWERHRPVASAGDRALAGHHH